MKFSVNILGKTKEKYIPWLPIPTQEEEYGTPYSHSGSALIVFWLKRVSQKTSAE